MRVVLSLANDIGPGTRFPASGIEHAARAVFGEDNVKIVNYNSPPASLHPKLWNQWFAVQVVMHRPDLLFLQRQDSGGEVIGAEAVRFIKKRLPRCVVTNWMGDVVDRFSLGFLETCRACDVVLVSNEGQLQTYRHIGAKRAEYLQIGYDWPEPPDWDPPFRVPEVVFCGTYNAQATGASVRAGIIQALVDANIDVAVVGRGWPDRFPVVGTCSVAQQLSVYRRAKVALSINHYNDIQRYYSDRQLITVGSGTATVCHDVPGLQQDFVDGWHCIACTSPEQFVSATKLLLEKEEKRRIIGARGRAEVISGHTWINRMLSLVALIEPTIKERARKDMVIA